MTPPINIDGTNENYSNVTIDGQDVEQITIDGQDVLSAIPDSGNLKARYDARELSLANDDSVTSWPDETGNGNDLTGGSPTFRDSAASNLGPVPSVRFDGVDDGLSVTFGSSTNVPFHVFYLGKYNTLNDFEGMWGEDVTDEFKAFTVNGGSWRYDGFSGEQVEIGSSDTNPHVFNHRVLSDNPSLRLDGSDVGGGTISLTDMTGLTLGSKPDDSNHSEVEFTEILVYTVDEENAENETSIESYLDRDTSLI